MVFAAYMSKGARITIKIATVRCLEIKIQKKTLNNALRMS